MTKSIKTKCAICQTFDNSAIKLPSNFDTESFTVEVFSARRVPDRRYFQWVECKKCGLWRSDPIIELPLENLYSESSFDYDLEVEGLKKTYLRLFRRTKPKITQKVLEIGGGNGFFLDAILDNYDAEIAGVEPSLDAVSKSSKAVKPFMKTQMMESGLYPNNFFTNVSIFHVLDHLPEPEKTLRTIWEVLEDNGTVLIAVHNVRSWSSRLLRSRSPIFDVEHTYLYDKKTISKLLKDNGFRVTDIQGYWNLYSLLYVIQLLPLPTELKLRVFQTPSLRNILGAIRLWLPLGNMSAVGQKVT